jgi:hypothetical protein
MDDTGISEIVTETRAAFAARLGVHGRDMAATVRRAGRMVPRRLRPAAGLLVEAERMAANPRLARLVDAARVETAARDLRAWLDGIDPRERRITRALGILATIALNLLILTAVVIVVLVWRDIL